MTRSSHSQQTRYIYIHQQKQPSDKFSQIKKKTTTPPKNTPSHIQQRYSSHIGFGEVGSSESYEGSTEFSSKSINGVCLVASYLGSSQLLGWRFHWRYLLRHTGNFGVTLFWSDIYATGMLWWWSKKERIIVLKRGWSLRMRMLKMPKIWVMFWRGAWNTISWNEMSFFFKLT